MESGGSMPHSKGLSNNSYPESNQSNPSYWYLFLKDPFIVLSSHLCLGISKALFPVGVPVKILKALRLPSILATWPAYLNLLDLWIIIIIIIIIIINSNNKGLYSWEPTILSQTSQIHCTIPSSMFVILLMKSIIDSCLIVRGFPLVQPCVVYWWILGQRS